MVKVREREKRNANFSLTLLLKSSGFFSIYFTHHNRFQIPVTVTLLIVCKRTSNEIVTRRASVSPRATPTLVPIQVQLSFNILVR